jgi:hypothetical protein
LIIMLNDNSRTLFESNNGQGIGLPSWGLQARILRGSFSQ